MIKFLLLLLTLLASPLPALDLWLYPEAAGEYAFYSGVFAPAVSFEDGFSFAVQRPELFFDFVLPGKLPFSLGAFIQMPEPNLKHFGPRAAYHINIGDEKTDLFFLYVFDCGFIRNDLLLEYNDTPAERRYYDFRAGVRRLFGKYIALSVESGYKLFDIRFGLAVKIN